MLIQKNLFGRCGNIVMGHYVYKYVYDGKIIYIGKNDTNLKNRINQHKSEEKFKPYKDAEIYYIELNNSVMSDVVESELIRRYKPVLNVAKKSDWCGLDFVEPEWKKFIDLPHSTKLCVNKQSRQKIKNYNKIKKNKNRIKILMLKKNVIIPKIIECYENKRFVDNGKQYIFCLNFCNDSIQKIKDIIDMIGFDYNKKDSVCYCNLISSIVYEDKDCCLYYHISKKFLTEVLKDLNKNFVELLKTIMYNINKDINNSQVLYYRKGVIN